MSGHARVKDFQLNERRMPREQFEAAWREHQQLLTAYWRAHGRNRQWLIDPLEEWMFNLGWKPIMDASLLRLYVAHLELRAWQTRERCKEQPAAPQFPDRRMRYPTQRFADLGMRDTLAFNS